MCYTQHHVWFTVPAWGHLTAAAALVTRMLEVNPSLVVTFVTHKLMGARCQEYLYQYKDFPKDRLRLVADGHVDPTAGPEFMKLAFKQQCDSMSKTLAAYSSPGNNWPNPTALILDQYGSNIILPDLKKIIDPGCKTFMQWSPSAACLYGFLAPIKASGISDFENAVQRIYEDDNLRKGRERQEILEGIMRVKNGSEVFNGTVLKVPGVTDMYDYEREMTNVPEMRGLTMMVAEMIKLGKAVDGIIVTTSEVLEAASIEACREFQDIYAVGIQVAARGWGQDLAVKNEGIRTFLDKNRKKSVLYISFGSMSYPTLSPDQVINLIEILCEMEFPFVLCLGGLASKNAIPEGIMESTNSSGKGWIHNSWVDQQAILQHPSVGWFLSHGGWNSISESMAQGIPMILWPLQQSDQALNAALLSTRDDPLGFELLQIRHGAGRAPAMRTGKPISGDIKSVREEFRDVLSRARGPEGLRMRENAQALAVRLRAEKDGKADAVIRELALV